jgi:hypothetical protein
MRLFLTLDTLGMQLQKVEDGLSSSKDSRSPITSGKLKRRDTIEKNLDEMFSSDQETELEMKEPKRKRQKHRDSVVSNENLGQKISPPSPIMEPFHGFQEHEANQIKLGAIAKGQTSKGETNLSNFASMPHLTTSLLQVDLNGNTFGMSSVLASPISDFNSDFDGDENHESSEKKRAPCIEEHNRLPMSVQMNYPMVQYLKQALKNDTNVIKELDRLLGSPSIAASFSLKMQEKIIGDTPKASKGSQCQENAEELETV